MAARKVTISMDADELAWLEQRANRVHGRNVSAAFAEAVQLLRRRETLLTYLHETKAPRLSPEDVARVILEIRGMSTMTPETTERGRTP